MAQLSGPPTSFCTAATFRTFSPTLLTPVQNSLRTPDLIQRSMEVKLLLHTRQQRRVPSNCWSQGRVPQVSPKQRRGGLPLNLQRILKSLLLRLALHCSERFREAFLLFIDSFSSSPAFYTNPTAQHALSGTGTLQPEPFLL